MKKVREWSECEIEYELGRVVSLVREGYAVSLWRVFRAYVSISICLRRRGRCEDRHPCYGGDGGSRLLVTMMLLMMPSGLPLSSIPTFLLLF